MPVDDAQIDAGNRHVARDRHQEPGQRRDIAAAERLRNAHGIGRQAQIGEPRRIDLHEELVGDQAAVQQVGVERHDRGVRQLRGRDTVADDPDQDQQHRKGQNDLVPNRQRHGTCTR